MTDWIPLKARYNSKCITCEQPTNTGFDILWKKGIGVIHPNCRKPDENTEHNIKPFCHDCKTKLRDCKKPNCQLCKYTKSYCSKCDSHVSVVEMK